MNTKRTPIEDRLWPRVEEASDLSPRGWSGCWVWMGCTGGKVPYGHIGAGGQGGAMLKTHRVAYELVVGKIPDGLQIDHLCGRTLCCNPRHLEPVTQRENLLRSDSQSAKNAVKTHCPQGHPLSGDNLLGGPDGWYARHRQRRCRTCDTERQRRRKRELAQVESEGSNE